MTKKTNTGYSKDYEAFYRSQIEPLGVTEDNNYIKTYNPEAEHPMPAWGDTKIFSRDREGNLRIAYWTVGGEDIVYYNDSLKNPKPLFYHTLRLAEPKGDMKYKMPSKSAGSPGALPWFHPITVQAFRDEEKIDTIYLTEGVKKAWMGGLYGLHVIGLASITCYAQDGKIHYGIRKLIENCKVDNVVILWDGDCLNVSRKDIQVREEATRRPFGFFNAAKKIRKLVQQAEWEKPRSEPRIFFMHIKSSELPDSPKGLDDLLIAARDSAGGDETQKVVGDMRRLQDKGPYFYKHEISSTTDRLFRYFLLHREDVQAFYHHHSDVIGENEFYFRGDMYHYDDTNNEVRLLQPGWAKTLYWVGNDYFEDVATPSIHEGLTKRELKPMKKGTLSDRFGRNFQKYLKFYHGFVVIPDHFQYQKIVEHDQKEFVNRYYPFPHVPASGSWDNIELFLKHIFGEEEITYPKTGAKFPYWHLALDYLQIMLTEPRQQLPVLILYSPENQTGKSTFTELCYRMFGDNSVYVTNNDLNSDFNSIYAGRLLVMCEETMLERKKDAEKIKYLSTAAQMSVNEKNVTHFTVDAFIKFIFCSNNKRMVYLTKHDDRYWIVQVPPLPEAKRDPGLKARMWSEIPAFVHYLKNRQLSTEREARMHFAPTLLQTEALSETIRVNEPADASNLRLKIMEVFELDQELQKLEMPLKELMAEFLPGVKNRKWVVELLNDYLEVTNLKDQDGKRVVKRGEYRFLQFNEYANDGAGELKWRRVAWRGSPYVFHRKDFLKEEVVRLPDEPAPASLDIPNKAITDPVDDDIPW